jgi:DNA-binding transcriptional LysR family regulator
MASTRDSPWSFIGSNLFLGPVRLSRTPILLAFPETHSLASRNSVYWTDLREETILLTQRDPGRELEDLLIAKLVSPSDRPKINRQNVSREIIKSLIGAGFGVSLVTESDVGVSFAGLPIEKCGMGPVRPG